MWGGGRQKWLETTKAKKHFRLVRSIQVFEKFADRSIIITSWLGKYSLRHFAHFPLLLFYTIVSSLLELKTNQKQNKVSMRCAKNVDNDCDADFCWAFRSSLQYFQTQMLFKYLKLWQAARLLVIDISAVLIPRFNLFCNLFCVCARWISFGHCWSLRFN